MSDFQTLIAIWKSYCAINILILPKNFQNGGWVVGVVAMTVAGILVYFCALKLVQCALKIHIYSYRDVARAALGDTPAEVVDICVALCNLSFTIAQISFTLKALQSIILIDG
jgi:proton-coupled amino acid transporter